MTKPIGVKNDSNYGDGSGSSVVRYAIPLSSQLASAASVVATLYNRSIPPYYLRQRGEKCFGKRYGPVEKYSVLPERVIGGSELLKRARRSPAVVHIYAEARSLISVARSWSARPHSVPKTLRGEDHLKHRPFDATGGGSTIRGKPGPTPREPKGDRGALFHRCRLLSLRNRYPNGCGIIYTVTRWLLSS